MTKIKLSSASDPVFARTYLILISVFFIGIGAWVLFFTQPIESWWGPVVLITLILIGLYFLVAGLFLSNAYAETLADKTGNHEALFLIVALASIIAVAIKKLKDEKSRN